MDVGVVGKKTFLMRVIEISAMIDGRLVTGCSTEDLWAPCVSVNPQLADGCFVEVVRHCIQMAVEMNDADRAICSVDTP